MCTSDTFNQARYKDTKVGSDQDSSYMLGLAMMAVCSSIVFGWKCVGDSIGDLLWAVSQLE